MRNHHHRPPPRRLIAAAATLLALAGGAIPARATLTLYTDAAAFNAAVTAPGIDSFESLAVGLGASPLTRSAGGYAYGVRVERIVDALLVERLDVDLAAAPPQHVDDLEFEDPGGIGAQRAAAFEIGRLLEDRQQRLGDDVLGDAVVAQLQPGKAQQRRVQIGKFGLQAHVRNAGGCARSRGGEA